MQRCCISTALNNSSFASFLLISSYFLFNSSSFLFNSSSCLTLSFSSYSFLSFSSFSLLSFSSIYRSSFSLGYFSKFSLSSFSLFSFSSCSLCFWNALSLFSHKSMSRRLISLKISWNKLLPHSCPQFLPISSGIFSTNLNMILSWMLPLRCMFYKPRSAQVNYRIFTTPNNERTQLFNLFHPS